MSLRAQRFVTNSVLASLSTLALASVTALAQQPVIAQPKQATFEEPVLVAKSRDPRARLDILPTSA